MKLSLILVLSLLIFVGCNEDPEIEEFTAIGLKPSYSKFQTGDILNDAKSTFQELNEAIVDINNIYFIDTNKGIHVINNEDKTTPFYETFLNIPGLIDIQSLDETIIINTITQLLTVEKIEDHYTVNMTFTKPAILDNSKLNLPPNYVGHFECIDPSMQLPTSWIETELTTPLCEKTQ